MLKVYETNSSIQQQSCRGSHPQAVNKTTQDELCPRCNKKTGKVIMYSCCLGITCPHCYSNLHYEQCSKKDKTINQYHNGNKNQRFSIICQRCEQPISNTYYTCKQCKVGSFCQICFKQTHSTIKFQMHFSKQNNFYERQSQANILICPKHKKIRNIVTENAKLVCLDCVNDFQLRKYKLIDFQQPTVLKLMQMQLLGLFQSIEQQDRLKLNQWNQIKKQLNVEYEKLCALLKERYDQNMAVLNQMQEDEMRSIRRALRKSKEAVKECSFDYRNLGISKSLLIGRMGILCCQLSKDQWSIQQIELHNYKISCVEHDKLRNFLKNWTVYKQKLKDLDKKKNQEARKLSESCKKALNKPNLIKKSDKSKGMMRSRSTFSINRSPQKQSHLQQIQIQIPSQGCKIQNRALDSKLILSRKSSSISTKLQELTPLMLSLDFHEAGGNRINLPSAKTQLQIGKSESNKQGKSKINYFDLLGRVGKTSRVGNEKIQN